MAFPLVSLLFWEVEYDRPLLNSFRINILLSCFFAFFRAHEMHHCTGRMPWCQILRYCYHLVKKGSSISMVAQWWWIWIMNLFLWAAGFDVSFSFQYVLYAVEYSCCLMYYYLREEGVGHSPSSDNSHVGHVLAMAPHYSNFGLIHSNVLRIHVKIVTTAKPILPCFLFLIIMYYECSWQTLFFCDIKFIDWLYDLDKKRVCINNSSVTVSHQIARRTAHARWAGLFLNFAWTLTFCCFKLASC